MRILGILIVLLAALPAVIIVARPNPGQDHPRDVRLYHDDNGARVDLKRGGTLVVALPAEAPREAGWALAAPAPDGLMLEGSPIWVAPEAVAPAVGEPGTQVFIFTAREAGVFELALAHPSGGGETWAVEMQVH